LLLAVYIDNLHFYASYTHFTSAKKLYNEKGISCMIKKNKRLLIIATSKDVPRRYIYNGN